MNFLFIIILLSFENGVILSYGKVLSPNNLKNPYKPRRLQNAGAPAFYGKYSAKYGVYYSDTNYSFDRKNGKTYTKLYAYYLPYNFYDKKGYYSVSKDKIYYDGYGYNFYYGKYGYYETSPTDVDAGNVVIILIITLTTIALLCCCPAYAYYAQK